MADIWRRHAIATVMEEVGMVFQRSIRQVRRRYNVTLAALVSLIGITGVLSSWQLQKAGRALTHIDVARVREEGIPVAPFRVEDVGAVPTEGIKRRWHIQLGPEQPIPRWHPTDEEVGAAPLLEAGKSYRLTMREDLAGVIENCFAEPDCTRKRSSPSRLSQKALRGKEGIPILPEKSVHLLLRWTPDVPTATAELFLETLSIPADEYRDFLLNNGIPIRPVPLPD